MRIGYAKLGRSMPLNPADFGKLGGDNEPPVLLNKLARRMPQHEFVIIGRNSCEQPQDVGLPDNVTNPWANGWQDEWRAWRQRTQPKAPMEREQIWSCVQFFDTLVLPEFSNLDAMIVWAGQHGTSNSPIWTVGKDKVTNPQDAFVYYGSYLVRGLSAWRDPDPHGRQEIWLCPDPRNYLKARDIKWPPSSIMCQYRWTKNEKHYRYGDPTDPQFFGCTWAEPDVWSAKHVYTYSGLELVGFPSDINITREWNDRTRFGMIVNETRGGMKYNRLDVMKQWVVPLGPDWVAGKWTASSLRSLGMLIEPIPWHTVWDTLGTVRSTFTTPASGSAWATAKPWECFASGTVCFFHPRYDEQNHILGRPGYETLKDWLRVDSPDQLRKRVDAVNSSRETWAWLVAEQLRLYNEAMSEQQAITEIEERLKCQEVAAPSSTPTSS